MSTRSRIRHASAWVILPLLAAAARAEPTPPGKFVQVADDDVGGHYFSQVIYAPTIGQLVTWGTRSHSKPIRAHETQHFLPERNEWIDAWPAGKEGAWGSSTSATA